MKPNTVSHDEISTLAIPKYPQLPGSVSHPKARPFLRWAGGKTQLLPVLTDLLPQVLSGTYHEPFLGSGALFFHLSPERAVLSDSNEELINAFLAAQHSPQELVMALRQHSNTEEHYYALRRLDPETLPAIQRAARLIFLNRTCYNGLYRVNRAGKFNTPLAATATPGSVTRPISWR